MSRKNLVQSFEMFTGQRMTSGGLITKQSVPATTAQTSVKSTVETLDAATINVKFSAPNSGTLVLQARNIAATDNEPEKGWYELNFGSPMTITSETEVQILLNTMPFTDIRLIWTPTAGAGVMSAFLNMKSVGA